MQLFDTTTDFSQKLKAALEEKTYDVLIHAAAVADYSVDSVLTADGRPLSTAAKIQGDTPLLLKLVPNAKILRSVRSWSKNPEMKLISFKLTSGEGSTLKLETYDSDLIVHNELSQVKGSSHQGVLYQRPNQLAPYEKIAQFQTKSELSKSIQSWIEAEFSKSEFAKEELKK